jgi:hypothetical protein
LSAPSQFLDSLTLDDLRLPYDRFAKKLDGKPRLVAGSSNVYPSQNESLRKRGGFGDSALTGKTLSGRVDRLGSYRTFDDKVYLIASVFNDTAPANEQWAMYYLRLDPGGAGTWTLMPNVRGMNESSTAHEWTTARGKVYIKGFPKSGVDLLGSVIFDGSGATPSTHFWGLLGPTVPAAPTAQGTWGASPQSVTVRVGWTYVYTWVTDTGHESPRSPAETDPSASSSSTGTVTNLIPRVNVKGHPDTTRVPTVRIYRSSDGGGSYRFVEDITNTGDVTILYIDDSVSGNPVPDARLDPSNVAPSVTSNATPPAVDAPEVTGVDEIEPSTPPVYWRGRIWYGLGSTLFFSGDEEIRKGIPLEAFPTGFFGNFFPFESKVLYLMPTEEALYVVTEGGTEAIVGRFRDEFTPITIQSAVGGALDHPMGSEALGNAVYWITQDFRVVEAVGRSVVAISPPLGTDLIDAEAAGAELALGHHLANGIVWLVAAAIDRTDPTNSKLWMFDPVERIWSPPWSGAQVTALNYGRYRETDKVPTFTAALWVAGSPGTAAVGRYQDAVYTDALPGSGDAGYAFAAETNLLGPPPGNQLNSLMVPGLQTSVSQARLEWQGSPTAPTFGYATDDSSGAVTTVTGANPTHTANDSVGYTTKFYDIDQAGQRAKVKVSRGVDTEEFILESIVISWEPRQGL